MSEQVDQSADDVPCDLVRPVSLWTRSGSQYNPDSHAGCRECPIQPALAHRETTLCRAPVTAGERPVGPPQRGIQRGVRSVSIGDAAGRLGCRIRVVSRKFETSVPSRAFRASDFTVLIEGASGPQPHCGFIEVFGKAFLRGGEREVEGARRTETPLKMRGRSSEVPQAHIRMGSTPF